jgi:hypothetical protein
VGGALGRVARLSEAPRDDHADVAETEVESFSEPADSDRVAILEVIEQFDHTSESGDAEARRRVCGDGSTARRDPGP